MSKKRLSEQFREQLDSLGRSLAAHTRSLDDHFDNQEAFLALRQQELEQADQKMLPGNTELSDLLEMIIAPYLEGDYKFLTVRELRKICSENGIRKYSSLLKGQLIELLQKEKIKAPPLPIKKILKKVKRSNLEKVVELLLRASSGL